LVYTPTPYINYNINFPLHVRILIAEKRRARATWQTTKYSFDKRKINNLANKLKRLLASIRSQDYTKHLNSLSSTNNSLWQTTRKILRSQPLIPPPRKTDGTWAINDLEKASIFRQHLFHFSTT